MKPVDLTAVAKLCEVATPGPWAKSVQGNDGRLGGNQWWTVNRAHDDGRVIVVNQARQVCRIMKMEGGDDAAFIAAARTLVPAMAAEIFKLRAQLEMATEFRVGGYLVYIDPLYERWFVSKLLGDDEGSFDTRDEAIAHARKLAGLDSDEEK